MELTSLLQGTHNARELTGLPVTGGGTIASGLLFRADALAGLTDDGLQALTDLGIGTVIDLRTDAERSRAADRLPADGSVTLLPLPMQGGAMDEMVKHLLPAAGSKSLSVTQVAQLLKQVPTLEELYIAILTDSAAQFATVARTVLDAARTPRPGVLFHCTAGKDRTGLAAAVGLFRPPWRVRGWLILLGFVFIAMLFWGKLADLEHLLAVLLILVVDRTLRVRHTTVREQRLIAVMAILVLGAVEIITTLLPTDGPFGPTEPASGGFIDLAIDLVVILVLVNGLRRGRRWTWVLALLLGILNIVTAALVLTLITVFSQAQVDVRWDGETELALANGFLWLIMLVYLIWVRRAFHARRKSKLGMQPSPTADDMKHELRTHGGGTLSWMTTWDGNSYARVPGGIVPYQRRNGVALALADPIGPAHARAEAVQEFIRTAELAGLVPCFFSADEATRAAAPSTWRSIVVADDTIVDLPGLEFTGKRWNSVRTSLNKAGREDMTFRMTHFKAEPWGVQQQLRAISEAWVGDKDLPEMRFTLGTLDEAEDPEVRLALALAPNGDVDGFLSWLPVYGDDGEVRGWTLDLMRRREGGFGPVMEFLIGSSARQFSGEGAQIMSLSGAPLAHDYPPDAGVIAALSDRLAEALEPVYGFGSLHRFKQKFHPRYETMYLLFRDESDLTRIGGALTRAFLPDATLRQFAGAGLELVRGGGKD